MSDFINEEVIFSLLEKNAKPDKKQVQEVIEKAKELKGLSLEDTSILLNSDNEALVQPLFDTARQVKDDIYGKRLVLFAPLYVSNVCANNCLYCAFRRDNKELKRKTLTIPEVKREIEVLENMGHKRVLLVYGETMSENYIKNMVEAIEAVYSVKTGKGEIRRVNVNIAPLSVEDFRTIKATNIGTYQCFQETYHHETYKVMHPIGNKADYEWRLYSLDRAQEAGIDDVAMGALFGLYNWKFEVMAMLQHAEHLNEVFGVGPHTISVPRIEPAQNSSVADKPPYDVTDLDFKRIISILRLAVPYTGIILSTRENAQMRRELFDLGVSQISAGSRTYPGAYSTSVANKFDAAQFTMGDTRTLDEVIYDMASMGYIPSFCTGCYRMGRTGQDFMELAKPGLIREFCLPNAITTFQEYLEDYASPQTREIGMKVIKEQLMDIPNEKRREDTRGKLEKIAAGERDLYY